jgi:hypothetical protein
MDMLCHEPVLTNWGKDKDANFRLDMLGEDDNFMQEILGKVEIYHISTGIPGCMFSTQALVIGRQTAAEWLKDQILEEAEQQEDQRSEEEILTLWRQDPLDSCYYLREHFVARVELFHTFESEDERSGYRLAYEAADYVCECDADEAEPCSADVEADVWEVVKTFPWDALGMHHKYLVQTLVHIVHDDRYEWHDGVRGHSTEDFSTHEEAQAFLAEYNVSHPREATRIVEVYQ